MNISFVTFDGAPLSYAAGVIAEGLFQLNHSVSIHSDLKQTYFNSAAKFLPSDKIFNKFTSIQEAFANDLIIIDASYTQNLNIEMLLPFRDKCAVLDMSDSAPLRNFSKGMHVFCSHLNNHTIKYNDNLFYPLPFGMSKDLIENANSIVSKKHTKNNTLIYNFTPSSNQSVRAALALSLLPILSKNFKINFERKSELEYLENLNSASAVLAYCGDFQQDLQRNEYLKMRGVANVNVSHSYYFETFVGDSNIARWDSWRFYEACICSTVPIHLDFEKYGFQLPKNPIPWEEYIPIDLENLQETSNELINRIKLDNSYLSKCGERARSWAINNFSPINMAKYVIKKIFIN